MATCGTPSSLMLTYAASTVHPQDLTPSFLSFKPKSNSPTSSLSLFVLRASSPRKLCKWVQISSKPDPCRVAVSALATETDVVEDVEATGGEAAVATTTTAPPPKPKKGKAALPLKRDRVRMEVSFFC